MTIIEGPDQTEKRDLLVRGASILRPLLESHGFTFVVFAEGRGSGGSYAAGRFTRGDQCLEFHFRHTLGMVSYHWGDDTITHDQYMRSLGLKGQYPGFSDDPLDGFRHLRIDLQALTGFLEGTDQEGFKEACCQARERPTSWLP
jgi:hypothetical protein